MEAKTKFNIGETIYFMHKDMPSKEIISGITIFTGKKYENNGQRYFTKDGEFTILYHLGKITFVIEEKEAYASKEDLQSALFSSL